MVRSLLPLLAILSTTAACSSFPVLGGESTSTSGDRLNGSCDRDEVLNAASGGRRTALERGFAWLDANVPYSQSRTHDGYRTDCSGFVSMCWDTGTSYTTATYYSGGAPASDIGGFEELEPADAVVRRGHMMLFAGWADSDHTSMCVLEQASTASDMQFRAHSVSSLQSQGYKAIRASNLPSEGTSSSTSETPQGEDTGGETEGTSSGSGTNASDPGSGTPSGEQPPYDGYPGEGGYGEDPCPREDPACEGYDEWGEGY